MPGKTSPRTDPLICSQLIDLLNETGRLEEERCSLPRNDEVSERIHDCILLEKWQDRFERLPIVSSLSRMRGIEPQEPHSVQCGALVC